MTIQTQIIMGIAGGDEIAARTFVERYASPLFRYVRLDFNDHFRAGEFIEMYFARLIQQMRNGDREVTSLEEIFQEARCRSRVVNKSVEEGKGISRKQKRVLELMDELSFKDRLALDLTLLEKHDHVDVGKWLDLSDEDIQTIHRNFEKVLSCDETIMEFLEHASIQQIRQRKAKQRSKQEDSKAPRREGRFQEESSPVRSEQFQNSVTRTWHEKDSRTKTGSDSSRTSETESTGTDPEHKKSRPRRRRVDPRKLNIDI